MPVTPRRPLRRVARSGLVKRMGGPFAVSLAVVFGIAGGFYIWKPILENVKKN